MQTPILNACIKSNQNKFIMETNALQETPTNLFIMMRCDKFVTTVLPCYAKTLCVELFKLKFRLYLRITQTSPQATTGIVASDTYSIMYLIRILYTQVYLRCVGSYYTERPPPRLSKGHRGSIS